MNFILIIFNFKIELTNGLIEQYPFWRTGKYRHPKYGLRNNKSDKGNASTLEKAVEFDKP